MSLDQHELLAAFVQEGNEHLECLEADLLNLEKNGQDKDLINRIFRSVHSVKGTSGFFGLTNISQLAHVLENCMALLRDGEIQPSKALVDVSLSAADKLSGMVNDPGNSASINRQEEIDAIEHFLNNTKSAHTENSNAPEEAPLPEALQPFVIDKYLLKEGPSNGHLFYIVNLHIKKDIKEKNKRSLDFFMQISSFGEYIDSCTDISQISGLDEALDVDLSCKFLFSSLMDEELIQMAWDIPSKQVKKIPVDVIKNWVESSPNEAPQSQSTNKPAESAPVKTKEAVPKIKKDKEADTNVSFAPAGNGGDDTVRISVALLDDLMNLAGEIVLSRNQLFRLIGMNEHLDNGLAGVLQNIKLVISELQDKVMQTRLQPVGTIFGKFHRIIRDLSNKLQKEAKLVIVTTGEEVELDKSIIQVLSDPLTHMIRNCIDHGIEKPEDRVSNGKKPEGSIKLSAQHIGGQVHIELLDDGKGIDPQALRKKAVEKDFITHDEAAALTDAQAQQLIFTPGLSTAKQTSDISGRGVGMDVVRANIEKFGGEVDLESVKGKYTKVRLRLPLTLAIIQAMIVGSRNRRFAFPQSHLEEIIQIDKENKIEMIQNNPLIRFRGELLPLVDLAQLLDMNQLDNNRDEEEIFEDGRLPIYKKSYIENINERTTGHILVVKSEEKLFGIIVDKLCDSEEIVVKPISNYLRDTKYYAGSTILNSVVKFKKVC